MTMTISLNPALEEKLSRVASLTNRDINTVLEGLIADGLNDKLERLAAIQEGLDDLEAGQVVDHDEVISRVRATIARVKAERS